MLSSKIIKKITACCCMAAVMLAASGCSDSKSYVSNSNEPKELKITYVTVSYTHLQDLQL